MDGDGSKMIFLFFFSQGDQLIFLSQIVFSCQMVYEEKYVVTKDICPLQAVGWEGS